MSSHMKVIWFLAGSMKVYKHFPLRLTDYLGADLHALLTQPTPSTCHTVSTLQAAGSGAFTTVTLYYIHGKAAVQPGAGGCVEHTDRIVTDKKKHPTTSDIKSATLCLQP